jgi:hypothetical protein
VASAHGLWLSFIQARWVQLDPGSSLSLGLRGRWEPFRLENRVH